jgi:hypothetical protein
MSSYPPSRILRRTVLTMALAGIAAVSGPIEIARAQYPERQVTMIVCFPAGGGTDIAARLINTQLAEALGKPVVAEGPEAFRARVAREVPMYKEIIDKAGLRIQ